jgi:hypothetical protein
MGVWPTGVQSRRSRHLGMGIPQHEKRYGPRRDAWSDDTSCSISKCDTHFRDFLQAPAGALLLHHIVTSWNASTVQEHLKNQPICYFKAGTFLDDIRTIVLLMSHCSAYLAIM